MRSRNELPADFRTIPLQDIIKTLNGVPWSDWLFEQLDQTYLMHFHKAVSPEDYQNLHSHISYMLTYFLPQHHVEVLAKARYEGRWSAIAKLADMKVKL